MKGKELALDDENLREMNTKKVVDSFEKIGNCMTEMRKSQRAAKWYMLIMVGILVLLIGGSLVIVLVKSKGNFLDNYFITENLNKRIVCEGGEGSYIFRSPEPALKFKELFNNVSCDIKLIDEITNE